MQPQDGKRLRPRWELPLTILGILLLAAGYAVLGCPFRRVLGIACPGCGMTRALRALLRLRVREALAFHPLVVLLPPLAVWALLGLLGKRLPSRWEKGLTAAVIVLFFAVYLLRLLQGDPVVRPDFSRSLLHTIFSGGLCQ